MARVIQVVPQDLRDTAGKIEGFADEYKTQYESIYTETGAMASSWDGADNLAFINQIDGFREDLKNMYQHMMDYASFLRNAADQYEATQSTVISNAQKLSN